MSRSYSPSTPTAGSLIADVFGLMLLMVLVPLGFLAVTAPIAFVVGWILHLLNLS